MSEITTKRKIKVIHFREQCIGCGVCCVYAGKNWIIDEDGKATLIDSEEKKMSNQNVNIGEIDQQDYESNKEAEEACPMQIIKIED